MKEYRSIAEEKFRKLAHSDDVLVLGVESSCDETACAVVKNGREILSNVISSQIEIHRLYGGVVPEIASRNHVLAIAPVAEEAIRRAGIDASQIDAVAVTYGAGLVGALLVGVSYAKSLAQALEVPLLGVNHIEGHICSNYLTYPELTPPYLCLLASGGHTALVEVEDYTRYHVLSCTIDDAAGEAFDKVARCLDLPYPGGPKIDALITDAQTDLHFPSAVLADGNFSYSGLKTAVINLIHRLEQKGEPIPKKEIALAFTRAAIDGLTDRCIQECRRLGWNKLAVAGGVGANNYLRNRLLKQGEENGIRVFLPRKDLCTDNACMIASQGYYLIRAEEGLMGLDLNAKPTLKLRFRP